MASIYDNYGRKIWEYEILSGHKFTILTMEGKSKNMYFI